MGNDHEIPPNNGWKRAARDAFHRLLDDLESNQQSIVRYQAVLKVRGEGPEGRKHEVSGREAYSGSA